MLTSAMCHAPSTARPQRLLGAIRRQGLLASDCWSVAAFRTRYPRETPGDALAPESRVERFEEVRYLSRQVSRLYSVDVAPLNDDEDLVWRSLMQLVFTLPRALGEDLQRACGLSSTEYTVLMHLSEATDGQLPMSELARRTNLSPSRITRVIDTMARLDLVERRPGALDGRTTLAMLTKVGLATLRRAWPHHVRSVRARAFDRLTP